MLPSKMKCEHCDCWAYMGDGRGECGQMDRPERLTKFFVRHLVPDPATGLVASIAGPPPDTKYECAGALITDADFFCASFEERDPID